MSQSCGGESFCKCAPADSSKNLPVGTAMLEGFDAPNQIQPGEYSTGGGTDGLRYESLRGERELERVELERQRQRSRRQRLECWKPRLLSRKLQISPAQRWVGVFTFSRRPFTQPPTCLPTSSICEDTISNFLSSSAPISHVSLTKNLMVSMPMIARSSVGSFSAGLWYAAMLRSSSTRIMYASTFSANVYRHFFGKLSRYSNHSLYTPDI